MAVIDYDVPGTEINGQLNKVLLIGVTDRQFGGLRPEFLHW